LYSQLRINEVLAHTHGSDPDLIELYYDGPAPLDLTDISLTDDPGDTRKFVFSSATVVDPVMAPGEYMILYGDLDGSLKGHLGFALSADGEGLYLYDKPSNGGGLVDSVRFGPQINDYSIGRTGFDGNWKLNRPTFGTANAVQPLGDARDVRINEWFANGEVLFEDDFIELHNPGSLPVDLSTLYLTDDPVTQQDKCMLGPLSFVDPNGYAVFIADDSSDPGHLNFRLSADGELLVLYDSELSEIDQVLYGPQTTDVSQGLAPDGSDEFDFFTLPTPGVSNGSITSTNVRTVVPVPEASDKRVAVPLSADHIDPNWVYEIDFNDSQWLVCSGSPGGVGYERSSGYQAMISLDVESEMYQQNSSCYIRIPFVVGRSAGETSRVLLNGTQQRMSATRQGVMISTTTWMCRPS